MDTLLDVFAGNADRYADLPALRWRAGAGWQALTWREYHERVRAVALGLREIGVRPGDRVALLVSNRPELAVADLALLAARAVPVCLFDSFTDEQIATVLDTLGVKLAIVDGANRIAGAVRCITADELPTSSGGDLEPARPDDLVSVNYTSGTTGSLKGVRHTHRNVLWHAESFGRFMPVPPGTRFLAYLPRAHATERFVTTWYPLTRAGTVSLCPDPAQLGGYLRDVRPEFFGGVLRVWEKLYAGAVAAGVTDPAALGLDACRFAFSGGGALAESVQEFFASIGVPLVEGWGQSELVSAATCGHPDRIRTGTAGQALPGVEVRAAADGELLVRSGSRMLGYVGGATNVDADGWVHTDDLGEIDADGYVRVAGRRSEVLRLADGYQVPATRVESQLRANLLVDHACVVGEGQPALCAILVAPGADGLPQVVRDANDRLPARQRITRFAVLTDRWEPGRADELTHTGKLKRGLIADRYADLIAGLVKGTAGVAVE
jgi:long-chain acyl-CoA synthetase